MLQIVTQQQARSVWQLSFCYVCGQRFTDDNPSTRDHVPPKKIFLVEDRNWPLILPAHTDCNSEYSFSDEQAKGLIALLHATDTGVPPLGTKRVGVIARDGKPTGVLVEGLLLGRIVSKILRACHAALYQQFLKHQETNRAILLPLPIVDPRTRNMDQELPQHEMFCRQLKDNRKLCNVDRIEAYNGKFRFEVVWITADDGESHCGVFAIDIYSWHSLASEASGRSQGCCGIYRLGKAPIPENASRARSIEVPFTYLEPLNPFEE